MPQRAASPATSERPAPKSHTALFRCVDCGHEFRRRTKAGIHSTCPRCHGQAGSVAWLDRMVAASAKKVEQRQEGKQRRSTAAPKPKATPAPPSAPGAPTTPRRAPARIEPAPKPRPVRAASTPPAGAQRAGEASAAHQEPPAPAKSGGPGFWGRLLGHDDGDD